MNTQKNGGPDPILRSTSLEGQTLGEQSHHRTTGKKESEAVK